MAPRGEWPPSPLGSVALVPCLLWGLRAKSQFSGHWGSVLFSLALQATTRDWELLAQCPRCRSWLPFPEAMPGLRSVGTSASWGLSPGRGPHPGFTETLVRPLCVFPHTHARASGRPACRHAPCFLPVNLHVRTPFCGH